MAEYVTVADVEIISAGMAWKGGSVYYITAEHLADMVAAQADPLIRKPRVTLGHYDALFGALAGHHDPSPDATDGAPGFGSLINLRLVEGGAKIVADLEEVPVWLAEAMPSAYPTRSAEWIWDHETAGGHQYAAVLTDLALGGTWEPAVEDLADITREQAEAALAALLDSGPDAAAAALNITPKETPVATRTPTASVSQDRVCSAFEDWAWGDGPDGRMYWWFVRDIRVDPDEIIAAGDNATFRVPFATDGEYEVTFGEPVEVRDAGYVDLEPAAATAAMAARVQQRVIAENLPRPEWGDRTTQSAAATAQPHTEEESTMDEPVRQILVAQGHDPETATEEQINAVNVGLAAGLLTAPDPEAAAEGTETDTEIPEPETEPVVEGTPELAGVASGRTVTVDRSAWERTQAQVTELATARREQIVTELDAEADAAVVDGRITPASRDEWRSAIDAGENPDATATARADAERAALAALTPGRVPVTPGTAASSSTTGEDALLAASRARMGHTTKED